MIRSFVGTYRFLLHGGIIIQARNRCVAIRARAGSLVELFFHPEEGGDMFLRNIGLFSTDYTTLYHRHELFITIVSIFSNPTSISGAQ
jgi:hypothetical protein